MRFIEEERWYMIQVTFSIYVFHFIFSTGKCANQSWQAQLTSLRCNDGKLEEYYQACLRLTFSWSVFLSLNLRLKEH